MTIWTAFYWDDYIGDTQDLSLTEHGAYIRLLAAYYAGNGGISSDRTRLYRICSAFSAEEQEAVDAVVARYFDELDGQLWHDRCDAEIKRAQAKSESARKASEARWQCGRNAGASQPESGRNANAERPQSSPHPHPQPQGEGQGEPQAEPTQARPSGADRAPKARNGSPQRFEEFWALYPRRRDKKKASEIWARKKLDDRAETILHDVRERQEHDDQWKRGYIPLPTTYLNGERWEDEFSQPAGKSGGGGIDEWLENKRREGRTLDEQSPI